MLILYILIRIAKGQIYPHLHPSVMSLSHCWSQDQPNILLWYFPTHCLLSVSIRSERCKWQNQMTFTQNTSATFSEITQSLFHHITVWAKSRSEFICLSQLLSLFSVCLFCKLLRNGLVHGWPKRFPMSPPETNRIYTTEPLQIRCCLQELVQRMFILMSKCSVKNGSSS